MPISVTGRPLRPIFTGYHSSPFERGFTLLEIMLVMSVMAIVAAFVLPNLFRPATASLDGAARHLVRLLHVAAEEAQLRGIPLRWNAYTDHYVFELPAGKGEWQVLSEPPFTAQTLPEGVQISEVWLADTLSEILFAAYSGDDSQGTGTDKARRGEGKQVPLGSVVFMSDGMLTVADVSLHSAVGDLILELRPGPAGIRIRSTQP